MRTKSKWGVHFLLALMWPIHAFSTDMEALDTLKSYQAGDRARQDSFFCQGQCRLAKIGRRFMPDELKELGARYLIDAIKLMPGGFLIEDEHGRLKIGLYSLIGNQGIQVLIDGKRVYDPFDAMAFLYIPIEIIDFIDVYYGPNGTWYGEGSLIGTIDVNMKRAEKLSTWVSYESVHNLSGGFLANSRINTHYFGLSTAVLANRFFGSTNITGLYDEMRHVETEGFFDLTLSRNAQLFLTGGSRIDHSLMGDLTNFHNNVHFLKREGRRNIVDLFVDAGVFSRRISLESQKKTSLRSEIGLKTQSKPWAGHEMFFGAGSVLNALVNSDDGKNNPKLCRIFDKNNKLFSLCDGHFYVFAQEEWQIRPAILAVLGGRVALPLGLTGGFLIEVLPTMGVVVTPHRRWRLKMAFNSSWRPPIFEEVLMKNSHELDSERSRALVASLWFGDSLDGNDFQSEISGYLSKIDESIEKNADGIISNRHEIDMIGLSLNNKINFAKIYQAEFGIGYAKAYKKEFDIDGYASCQAGIYNFFSQRPPCEVFSSIPVLSAYTTFKLDTFSMGSWGVALNMFRYPSTLKSDERYIVLADISFTSKPIFRYLTYFLSAKNLFGGAIMIKENKYGGAISDFSLHRGTTFLIGMMIAL